MPQMPNMTPDQALAEVDQTCADAELSRARHVVLQTAVQVLRQVAVERQALGTMVEEQKAKLAALQKQVEELTPKDSGDNEAADLHAVEGEQTEAAPDQAEVAAAE